MIDPSVDPTVSEALALLQEALEEGAGDYDPALPQDVADLLLSPPLEDVPLSALPAAEGARWRALLARAGVFAPTRRVPPP